MSKRLVVTLGILGIVIMVGYFAYYLYTNYYLRSTVTLPPPLKNVDFPSERVPYPTDWTDDLRLPNEFVLVDSSTGTFPESTTQGWAAKFRFDGKPTEATKAISSFLEQKGWIIVESDKLDSGGFLLLIQRKQGNGVITIDADQNDSSQTLIIAMIFP